MARPFVKWLGGKSKLSGEIIKYCPYDADTYIEPFVGGGAVLFNILSSRPSVKTVYINDSNWPLICAYTVVKNHCKSLIKELKEIEKTYNNYEDADVKERYFYSMRDLFNNLKNTVNDKSKVSDKVKLAAAFIFLNKTSFNGLYRENSSGLYNSPWNKADHPTICDTDNLLECAEIFKKIDLKIYNLDFEYFMNKLSNIITDKTFTYFDPPYKPISETSSFTSYTKDGFDDQDQKHLVSCASETASLGAHVVISNSDHQEIRSLYKEFVIEEIQAARNINSKGDGRGKINELIIHN